MWVHNSLRGRGRAQALPTAAEDQARRLGCALVEFRAYDLLARGLHEQFGYETVGVIKGYPAGSAAGGTWDLVNLPSKACLPDAAARVGTSAELDALVSQRTQLDDINQGFPTACKPQRPTSYRTCARPPPLAGERITGSTALRTVPLWRKGCPKPRSGLGGSGQRLRQDL